MTLLDRLFSWYVPPESGQDGTLQSRARSLPVAQIGGSVHDESASIRDAMAALDARLSEAA